nr:cysteine hydrolase family protein [Tumebacillus amylolyticus]
MLVIDVQHGMFTMDEPVYRGAELLQTLQNLIGRARTAGVEVIYVRHEGGPGHLLERGKPEWEIHPEIAPLAGELVVDKNRPDSFFETVLQEELQARGVTDLVICGIQTDVCVDTTTRRAFSLGYDVTFVADGHSTWDSEFVTAQQKIDHHTDLMLRFADVKRAEEIEFFGE